MLNFFLVLGLVPGTNFQITFNEVVFAVIAMLAAYYISPARQIYRRHQNSKVVAMPIVQYSNLHSFSYPAKLAPEEQIDRKVVAPLIGTFVLRLNQAVRLARRAV